MAICPAAGGRGIDRFGRDITGKPPLEPPSWPSRSPAVYSARRAALLIDIDARGSRAHERPLPNLLAGSGAARGLSGPLRWGYLSGNGLLTATVHGRIAGGTAAKLGAVR